MNLMLTLLVALLLFGPNRLPMLARHLGRIMNRVAYYKEAVAALWQAELNQQTLAANIKKAQSMDLLLLEQGSLQKDACSVDQDKKRP